MPQADNLRALVGAPGHRLLAAFGARTLCLVWALVLAFALALLLRPSGTVADRGPVAVNCVESSDVALHTPRRAATSLDHDLRGFVSALISEVVQTWCSPAAVDLSPMRSVTGDAVRSRARGRPHPRGPPLG